MKKRHSPEQIVRKLREANAELDAGASVPEIARRLGVSEATFYPEGWQRTTKGCVQLAKRSYTLP